MSRYRNRPRSWADDNIELALIILLATAVLLYGIYRLVVYLYFVFNPMWLALLASGLLSVLIYIYFRRRNRTASDYKEHLENQKPQVRIAFATADKAILFKNVSSKKIKETFYETWGLPDAKSPKVRIEFSSLDQWTIVHFEKSINYYLFIQIFSTLSNCGGIRELKSSPLALGISETGNESFAFFGDADFYDGDNFVGTTNTGMKFFLPIPQCLPDGAIREFHVVKAATFDLPGKTTDALLRHIGLEMDDLDMLLRANSGETYLLPLPLALRIPTSKK
jgi:hypothetical protein